MTTGGKIALGVVGAIVLIVLIFGAGIAGTVSYLPKRPRWPASGIRLRLNAGKETVGHRPGHTAD